MIYGFAVAIIVGFLLTASQNWTGIRGVHGRKLALVASLWAAGRLSSLLPSLNPYIFACLDLCFLPVTGAILAPYVLRAGQRHNAGFLLAFAALWFGNVGFHFDRLGIWSNTSRASIYFAIYVIVLIILVVAGRVVPFFTERAISGYTRRRWRSLDVAIILGSIGFIGAMTADQNSWLAIWSGVLAGTLTLIRWISWVDRRVWRRPILWILYAGYAWLVAGFYLTAASARGLLAPSLALHAFTAGAITTMIVGMVSRVSLGHTGRKLEVSRFTVAAYALVLLSAGTRVVLPLVLPESYADVMLAAGLFWVTGLALVVVVYTPILLRPRADGRPD